MHFSWQALLLVTMITTSVAAIHSSYEYTDNANQTSAGAATKMICSKATLDAEKIGKTLGGTAVILDNYTLAKYPDLQEVLNGVDQHPYQPYQRPGENGFVAPAAPVPTYDKTISGDVTAAMLEDPSLNFTHPYTCGNGKSCNYTHLKRGDELYRVYIFFADCTSKINYMPPRQQIANGVLPENVICSDGLVLIKKLSDSSPACVRPQTAQRLAERGWGVLVASVIEGQQSSSKYLMMKIDQPKTNLTTLRYANQFVKFVSTEEFPITIFLPQEMNVTLKTLQVPQGVWTTFIPQRFEVDPNGTRITMVLAGAVKPFVGASNTTMVIMAESSDGRTINETLPFVQTENMTILKSPAPIEFPLVLSLNPNQSNFEYFGVVYDPDENITQGSISITLSVLGFIQEGKLVPLPSWLTVDIPEHSFLLGAKKPHFFTVVANTQDAATGNYVIQVKETVGGQQFMQPLKISVVELPPT